MSNVLVVGMLSGIGKFLYEQLNCVGLDVNFCTGNYDLIRKDGIDIIIQCAFNSNRLVSSSSLYDYINTNIFLTNALLQIPHQKFIFFSSVDVYPKNLTPCRESDIINLDNIDRIYSITKLMSESLVIAKSKDYLILRPTAMLGIYSKKNSLIKIIEDNPPVLTLNSNSTFNFVLYEDVYYFIKRAIDLNYSGIYNLASSTNITLGKLAHSFKKSPIYGSAEYHVGNISNEYVCGVFPGFNKSSLDVIHRFLGERK